jgi:hypothetical protein
VTKEATPDSKPAQPSAPSEIELSSLYWYGGQLPNAVALVDCSLKLPHVDGGLHGLYGHRGRHDGFMAARERAAESGLTYTVVDYRVQLSHKVEQKKRDADNMDQHEVFPAHGLKTAYAVELDSMIRSSRRWRKRTDDELTSDSLLRTLVEHPSAVNDLMALPELKHVRLFVYMAKIGFSQEAVPVATIPDRYLRHVTRAESRLDPDLAVRLPHRPRIAHSEGVPPPSDTVAPKRR